LGKAKGKLAFPSLLALIQATGYRLNNEASFQACDALQRWLEDGITDDKNSAEQLKIQDPTAILQSWLESSDERLVASAEAVLDMLD